MVAVLAAKGKTIPSILNPILGTPSTMSKNLPKQINDNINTQFNKDGQQMGRKGFFW